MLEIRKKKSSFARSTLLDCAKCQPQLFFFGKLFKAYNCLLEDLFLNTLHLFYFIFVEVRCGVK